MLRANLGDKSAAYLCRPSPALTLSRQVVPFWAARPWRTISKTLFVAVDLFSKRMWENLLADEGASTIKAKIDEQDKVIERARSESLVRSVYFRSILITLIISGGVLLAYLGLLLGGGLSQIILVLLGGSTVALASVAVLTTAIGSEAGSFGSLASRQALGLGRGLMGVPAYSISAQVLDIVERLVFKNDTSPAEAPSAEAPVPAPPLTTNERATLYEETARERLLQHSGVLGNRATFALSWGLIFAVIGVGILGWALITSQQPTVVDWVSYAAHYLPRLSITIIVELVAFFFLRTYARTLTDIRYIQNEITNVELKLIGFHRSVEQNLTDVTKKAVIAMVNTERNHILEKGQTSLEMERERVENEGVQSILASISQIVRGTRQVEDTKKANQEA